MPCIAVIRHRGLTGQSLRLAGKQWTARPGVGARGPPPPVAIVAAIRTKGHQHGAVVRGEPHPAAEQEPPWHGRLPAIPRRSTDVRVSGQVAVGEGARRCRAGRHVRVRALASRSPARADGSRAPARSPRALPGRVRGRTDRPGEHERAANIGRLFIALERERDEARRLAEERVAAPPRNPGDGCGSAARTAGTVKRRLRRATRRR